MDLWKELLYFGYGIREKDMQQTLLLSAMMTPVYRHTRKRKRNELKHIEGSFTAMCSDKKQRRRDKPTLSATPQELVLYTAYALILATNNNNNNGYR